MPASPSTCMRWRPARTRDDAERASISTRSVRICSRSAARPAPSSGASADSWQNTRCKRDDVRRQLIPRLAVRAGIGSDVQDRERQLGVPADHVVNPRRDAAGHERVGPLDQQADVRRLGVLGIVVHAERRQRRCRQRPPLRTFRVAAAPGTCTGPTRIEPLAAGTGGTPRRRRAVSGGGRRVCENARTW